MATTRTDDAIVHNETSRDNNNMIAPSGTAESFLFASMQHNAEMIKAFTNTFVTLQKQLCPIPTEIISEKNRKNTSTSNSSSGSTSGSSEKCFEDILEKLAKITNEGLRSKLNWEKIKVVADRYLKPRNMHNLKTPSVNNKIWRHLDRNIKKNRILSCLKLKH